MHFLFKRCRINLFCFLHLTLAALRNNDLASPWWWIISYFYQKKENLMLCPLFKGHTDRVGNSIHFFSHYWPLHTKLQSSHRSRGGNTCRQTCILIIPVGISTNLKLLNNTARDLTVCVVVRSDLRNVRENYQIRCCPGIQSTFFSSYWDTLGIQ